MATTTTDQPADDRVANPLPARLGELLLLAFLPVGLLACPAIMIAGMVL